MTPIPAELERLTPRSRSLAERLLATWPEVRAHLQMREGRTGSNIVAHFPSPTGDDTRTIHVWMEDDDDAIVDAVTRVMTGELVLVRDVGGKHDGHEDAIDLREPDALIEELTSRYSPGRAIVRTWSGAGDRVIGLDDLEP